MPSIYHVGGRAKFKLFEFDYELISLPELINNVLEHSEVRILVTPNIDHVVRASKATYIRDYYSRADICINDSKVLSTMVKLFLNKDLATVTGSDLTRNLIRHKKILEKTITIVGCEPQQVTNLQRLEYRVATINHINPPMKFYEQDDEINKVCNFVVESNADFIFLAVGSPQQEMLAHKLKPLLSKGVILCVGASIDYLTGKEKRAPIWIQNIRMEWFFRFLQSPVKRFRRYFINCPQIFYLLWKERKKAT
jgi:exopolysaccharide biosynthesis WecB/TagA/CpsF family protein